MTAKQSAKRPASTLVHVATDRTPRRVAFWSRESGIIQSDTGGGRSCSGWPLSRVLNLIAATREPNRVRVLYIIGGEHVDSEPETAWWAEPMAHGWGYDGYEMSASTSDRGHLNAGTYEREDGGVTVDVRMSARWFPGCDDPCVCVQAWNHLQTRLRATFGAGAALLATPAATGLDLLARSLPRAPHGHAPIEWPAAPEALQRVLYGSVGQGRMQWCAALDQLGRRVEQVYSLDGRWMYASCVSNLPVGTPTHTEYPRGEDAAVAYLPYVPAWYRVGTWVPREWAHIGLIPSREDGATSWPDTPGACIEDAWVSGAELGVALTAGWPVLISERWAYPDYQHTPGSNPAGEWSKRLRQLRAASQPAAYGDAAEPMAGALRHLLIDTIGMWHRREGEKLRITPISDQRPEGARIHHLDRKRGYVAWYEPVPLSRWATPWQRPEWSATVWGKSRAKLHAAALRLSRRTIIDLRNDAILLTEQPPASCWPDDGQPGTFRVKETLAGPFTLSARGLVKAKGQGANSGE